MLSAVRHADPMHTRQERFDGHRLISRKEAVAGVRVRTVDNDLAVVGLTKPKIARLVSGDEEFGVDHGGKPVGGFWRGVSAPGQCVNGPAAPASWPLAASESALSRSRSTRVVVARVGERMANVDAIRRPDRQRERAEKGLIRLMNIAGRCSHRPCRCRAGNLALSPSPSLPIERPVSSESS